VGVCPWRTSNTNVAAGGALAVGFFGAGFLIAMTDANLVGS
jgi:hypothetical protein